MKEYNDCSAVGSASCYKGCQVPEKLFAAVTAKRFLSLQNKPQKISLPWFTKFHKFSHI